MIQSAPMLSDLTSLSGAALDERFAPSLPADVDPTQVNQRSRHVLAAGNAVIKLRAAFDKGAFHGRVIDLIVESFQVSKGIAYAAKDVLLFGNQRLIGLVYLGRVSVSLASKLLKAVNSQQLDAVLETVASTDDASIVTARLTHFTQTTPLKVQPHSSAVRSGCAQPKGNPTNVSRSKLIHQFTDLLNQLGAILNEMNRREWLHAEDEDLWHLEQQVHHCIPDPTQSCPECRNSAGSVCRVCYWRRFQILGDRRRCIVANKKRLKTTTSVDSRNS